MFALMTASSEEPLFELLAGCRAAVGEEIDAVRADLERRGLAAPVAATDGLRLSGALSGLYEWRLPLGTYDVRVDDGVSIETETGSGIGRVVHFDRGRRTLRISTESSFGRHPGPAELVFDPSWLLEALDERLARLEEEPANFHAATALRLFGADFARTGEAPIAVDAGLNPSQAAALRRVVGSEAQFVWGPPGTGKTLLLGHVAAELAADERVLVAATTNGAVDEAAGQIAAVLGRGAIRANRIVRFGADLVAGADPALGVDAAVTRAEAIRPSALTRAIEELADRLGVRLDPDATVGARAAAAQAAARRSGDPADEALAGRVAASYQAAVRRAVDEADVVLTTFARLAVREELARPRYDALLIDEASTAPLPYVLFAASLARRRAAAFGDFQQLPAVVLSNGAHAERWMRRDIFRASGVLEADDGLPSPKDRLCSMLQEQYRMRPAIRTLVGDLFYGGRLRDGGPEPAAAPPDAPGALGELVMLDTTGLDPTVSRPGGSRMNEAHLEALIQLLEALSRSGATDVAVVAPYRMQVRELRRRVRSRLGRLAPAGLEVATIHRFQGREKRVVVFDTVDAPPDRSWFLDERRNRDFPRMLNVALSRSRDLLVVVGTIDGLRHTLPEAALLNRVVERICRDGIVLDAHRPGSFARLLDGVPAGS